MLYLTFKWCQCHLYMIADVQQVVETIISFHMTSLTVSGFVLFLADGNHILKEERVSTALVVAMGSDTTSRKPAWPSHLRMCWARSSSRAPCQPRELDDAPNRVIVWSASAGAGLNCQLHLSEAKGTWRLPFEMLSAIMRVTYRLLTESSFKPKTLCATCRAAVKRSSCWPHMAFKHLCRGLSRVRCAACTSVYQISKTSDERKTVPESSLYYVKLVLFMSSFWAKYAIKRDFTCLWWLLMRFLETFVFVYGIGKILLLIDDLKASNTGEQIKETKRSPTCHFTPCSRQGWVRLKPGASGTRGVEPSWTVFQGLC